MLDDSIKTLSETPLPKKRVRFLSARDAKARILELETKLGLPPSPPEHNLMRANGRFEALQDLIAAAEAATGAPVAAAPATPVPLAAPASPRQRTASRSLGTATEKCLAGAMAARNSLGRQKEVAAVAALLPKTVGKTKAMLEAKLAALETKN